MVKKKSAAKWLQMMVGLMVLSSLMGCIEKPKDQLVPREAKKIEESGLQKKILKFSVGEMLPYTGIKNGKPSGFAVEVLETALERIGYHAEIVVLPWSRAIQATYNGDVDGVIAIPLAPEREIHLAYVGEPLVNEKPILLTRKDNLLSFSGDLRQLTYYRIGALQGWYYGPKIEALIESGDLKVEYSTAVAQSVNKLINKRVDGVIGYGPALQVASGLEMPEDYLEERPIASGESVGLYVAFSRKRVQDVDLIEKIKKEIQDMKKDGTYEALAVFYGLQ